MATTVFRAFLTGAAIGQASSAPAPSGDTFAAFANETGGTIHFGRVSAAGTVTWGKALTQAGAADLSSPALASNGTHVALRASYTDSTTFAFMSVVALYTAAGTAVWQRSIAVGTAAPACFAIDASGNVFLAGLNANETVLVKLAAADGAVSWTVSLRGTGLSSGNDYSRAVAALSSGDVVVTINGPTHAGGSTAYVQRRLGSDGTVVWTRGLNWAQTSSATALAVDASDNIYLAGRAFNYGSAGANTVAAMKLDVSGALSWARRTSRPAGTSAPNLSMSDHFGMVATADGLYVPGHMGLSRFGHIYFPSGGEVAAGTAVYTGYGCFSNTELFPHTARTASDNILLTYVDTPSGGGDAAAIVVRSDYLAAGDGSYGPRARETYLYDVVSVSATSTTVTLTTTTNPTISSATFTLTEGSNAIQIEAYVPNLVGYASSFQNAASFGLPVVAGLVSGFAAGPSFGATTHVRAQPATGFLDEPTFGTPIASESRNATGFVDTAAFGTPSVSFNIAYQAAGIEPTAEFGVAWAIAGAPELPFLAQGALSQARFGRASAVSVAPATTASADGTAPAVSFGLPTTRLQRNASEFLAEASFGIPRLLTAARSFGQEPATQFGVPTAVRVLYAQPVLATPRLPSPAATASFDGEPTSIDPTGVFGTPTAVSRFAAEATLSRARFGVPSVVRDCT